MAFPRMMAAMKCLVIFLALLPLSVFADLKFDEKIVNLTAQPEDERVTAVFKFTNVGSQSVNIVKVQSDCGCISAEADKDVYKKGESGQVEAVFSIGSFEGEQSKSIFVLHEATSPEPKEDESAAPKAAAGRETLTVNISVPTIVEIEPKLTKWQQNGELTPKKITVTVKQEEPIHIKEVKLSRDQIAAKLITIEEGKKYEIELTPTTLEKPLLGMITLITDSTIPKHQRKMAFLSIEKKKS